MSTIKILVVEDEDLFADMVRRVLASMGHEAVHARNGKEAMKLFDPQTISLVLTDLIMPDMEGVELIVALRRIHPSVKVIAMTGGGCNRPEMYLPIAKRVGAMKTLAKPFSMEELQQAVTECLEAP